MNGPCPECERLSEEFRAALISLSEIVSTLIETELRPQSAAHQEALAQAPLRREAAQKAAERLQMHEAAHRVAENYYTVR